MRECVCLCVCVYVCSYMWGLRGSLQYPPRSLCTIFCDGMAHWTRNKPQGSLPLCLCSLAVPIDAAMLGFSCAANIYQMSHHPSSLRNSLRKVAYIVFIYFTALLFCNYTHAALCLDSIILFLSPVPSHWNSSCQVPLLLSWHEASPPLSLFLVCVHLIRMTCMNVGMRLFT